MPSARRTLQELAFAAILVLSALFREGAEPHVSQAVVWLPSGVAAAGLWLFGLRAAWAVAAATLVNRLLLEYPPSAVIPAIVGSVAEAVACVLVLRACGLRADFARLRDVLALFAAAAVAPVASILFSWFARQFPSAWHDMAFYSGWDGWWRMNALGILAVVPLALTWRTVPRPWLARPLVEGAALVAGSLTLLGAVMTLLPATPTTIMVLYLVLPLSLTAALRLGQRGNTAVTSTAALFVAVLAVGGHGPFQCEPLEARHVAIQVFLLTILGVPFVFGSLVAERDASRSQWSRSEGLRGALLEVLPDVTYRMSLDGTFLDVLTPSGVEPPLGRTRLLGRRIGDVAAPELAAKVLGAIAAAHRGTRPDPVEYPLDTDEGRRIREARYVRLGDGEVLAVVRDITERKRAERLLAFQAGILELMATGQPNSAVFPALVRGLESFVAGGLGSLLVREGRRLYVGSAPNLPEAFRARIQGFEIGPERGCCGAAAQENRTVVCGDIADDPAWRAFRDLAIGCGLRACWSVPVRNPAGAVTGTFAIYYRTPRSPTAAEVALVERAAVLAGIAIDRERRESLLGSIHQNVSDGLFRSVPGQGLVYANGAFARLFGYDSPDELLRAAGGGDGDPQHRADLARLDAGDATVVEGEVQLHRRDGTAFWGLLSRTVVRGADGQPTAWDGALADVTAQKQLAEQLRQAQKMEAVGKLAGGVAHDFNNLLTAIGGYAEAVWEKLPAGQLRNDVEEILRAAERAAGLTRQLLAFSRQQMLAPQVLDLADVVRGLGGLLQRLIGERIRLVAQATPGTHARVDKVQLEQVLLNLALNARDAMPDGGTLTIEARAIEVGAAFAERHVDLAPGPHVALAVRDTGSGMTAEVRARAFDPFFTTKEPGKGTGLGLSTVYGIVRQSGGAVWIDSEPHAGTTVWIYLPRVAADPAGAPPVPIPRPGPIAATVLVAEDEALVRDLVQRILTRAGYHVLAAADGPAALALAQQHDRAIDLLVTDAVMPQMGGRELANRLRAFRPQLPVLFVSGYASDHQQLTPIPGEVAFLAKPFAASRLLEQVAGLLDAARRRQPDPAGTDGG